ncbi:2,4'-dihydroxyacetophenone dioxygenase family protein [Yinghuangia soli]|uniref:2,4'-dihydroxyacetophenone dioxygenase family protein n=1 Tax=Yinghuangia soli TaxID=2908204 RepID=A0AA41PXX3_9ACTN|nr:2,4'-dihydroxyacetophenone dioxygenase family protein [Yinghuangia soli]MCF2527778.1 2,4'-dihydroxyacetophenone dioxygenase family protein [Yinghuangia soli]
MIPEAVHVGAADVPWVENTAYPGTMMRLLRADLAEGTYVMAGRLPAGLEVGTHRHLGAVHMFTLSGAWGYREHGYVNRAGSYLYEPPGSTHTLFVPADNTETTETLTIVHGVTEYLDAEGNVIGVSDAAANLRGYYESCEAAGIPRPSGIIL